MKSPIKTVAILGAGPAACTLAIHLARGGIRVALLHRPRSVPLLVGELEAVKTVESEMVFTPAWSPEMMSEDAKFALGY